MIATRFASIQLWLLLALIPAGACQVHGQALFRCGDSAGRIDETATVPVTFVADSNDGWQGFQFGVCHDVDLLTLGEDGVVNGPDFADIDDFILYSRVSFDDGWTVGALFNVFTGFTLEEGIYHVYEVTYQLEAVGTASLEFCETLGDPAITNRIIVNSSEFEPTLDDGEIEISDVEVFLRGDVDGDADVDGLLDSLYLLEWQFLGTVESPPCLDAADVNNDGTVGALLDGLTLLNWAFSSGSPPPAPGPDECGPDPAGDNDDLECETVADSCV